MDPPGWGIANTVAPNAPETNPVIAPVCIRLVGASLRKAQISDTNGGTANSGMQIKQTTHCGPKSIPLHAAGLARTSATILADRRARNGAPIRNNDPVLVFPGRADLNRKTVPVATRLSVNAGASSLRLKCSPLALAGILKIASIRQKAAAVPKASAMTKVLRSF